MKLLFVCTGNTCRSPMAEALWRHMGGEARSAGLAALPGQAMASLAEAVLSERGVPTQDHSARPLLPRDILAADYVLTMTAAQKEEVLRRFPWAERFVRTLGEASGLGGDIADPVGQGKEVYAATAEAIEQHLLRIRSLTPPPPVDMAVGADHAGVALKSLLEDVLKERQQSYLDMGTYDFASCDYPDFAQQVAFAVVYGKSRLGLLICGTGQGMAISANKVRGIRAAAVADPVSARLAREHNDANVLCLGARIIGEEVAKAILASFLEAAFQGGRHARRLAKIAQLEEEEAR